MKASIAHIAARLILITASLAPLSALRAAEVWHFLDPWHFHRLDGMEIQQGKPLWLKDKTRP